MVEDGHPRRAARGPGALLAAVPRLGRAGRGASVPVVDRARRHGGQGHPPAQVEHRRSGTTAVRPSNRRFYVIDERDRMINGKLVGELQQVIADYSDAERDAAARAPRRQRRRGRGPARGPGHDEVLLSAATGHAGRRSVVGGAQRVPRAAPPARRSRRETAVDRGAAGRRVADLASLAGPAGAGGRRRTTIDSRRFRMLIEIDGVERPRGGPLGRPRVRIGGATVGFGGHVGRCLITSRDPDTGAGRPADARHAGDYRPISTPPSRCRSGSTARCSGPERSGSATRSRRWIVFRGNDR